MSLKYKVINYTSFVSKTVRNLIYYFVHIFLYILCARNYAYLLIDYAFTDPTDAFIIAILQLFVNVQSLILFCCDRFERLAVLSGHSDRFLGNKGHDIIISTALLEIECYGMYWGLKLGLELIRM